MVQRRDAKTLCSTFPVAPTRKDGDRIASSARQPPGSFLDSAEAGPPRPAPRRTTCGCGAESAAPSGVRRCLDQHARLIFGISGEEFVRDYRRGRFRGKPVADDLASVLPFIDEAKKDPEVG
jgi:hypothetical protein